MPKVYVEMFTPDGEPDDELKQLTQRKFKCCLCGANWIGWGNNPDPLGDVETDRCCDFCNQSKVLPARLKGIRREGLLTETPVTIYKDGVHDD